MNNIAGTFNYVATIIGLILAIFIIDDMKTKIIICLLILVIAFFIKIMIMSIQEKKLQEKLKNSEDNRNALITQYSEKKSKVDIYEECWSNMNFIFLIMLSKSKEEQIRQSYELYLFYTDQIRRK